MKERLTLLRIAVLGAMQLLQGDDLEEFWQLMDEIQASRELCPPPSERGEGDEKVCYKNNTT